MKMILLAVSVVLILAPFGYGQDTAELISEVSQIYTGNDPSGSSGLIAGFSLAGLMGGILFGGVGFVAFMYGKSNSEFRPIILGILLMAYPLFVKNTIALYLIGAGLTAALFFWRE